MLWFVISLPSPMKTLVIHGRQEISGSVSISGSKNAALPAIAAALLFRKATLHSIPRIGDVMTLLAILDSLGVRSVFEGNTLTLDTEHLSLDTIAYDLVKKIRVGILLLPGLLRRFGALEMPYPGGCNLGKRPIDEHIDVLRSAGYEADLIDGRTLSCRGEMTAGDREVCVGLSVTATENALVTHVLRSGRTIIHLAAIEPHVICIIDMLRQAGAHITIRHDHTIEIQGVDHLTDTIEYTVIHDYIESGTFVILGALTARDHIDIHHARIMDLGSFLWRAREAGIRYEDLGNDTLRVYRSHELSAVKLQTNIFPGFPTDLQSPFAVLLTQADGISRVHEIMFEGRLNMLAELENMKAHPALLNPHEALIFGPTPLRGATVSSWDLRSGVSMIIAGLIATGETIITNVEYIERGYEDIFSKLEKLGAIVERHEG